MDGIVVERIWQLQPFLTPQNIHDPHRRATIWSDSIKKEYDKGRSLQQLQPLITPKIPYFTRSDLWTKLIRQEYDKGKPLKQLRPLMTPPNIFYEYTRSNLWDDLIRQEFKKGRSLQELEPFITPQDIPDQDKLSNLWSDLRNITREGHWINYNTAKYTW